LPSEAHLVNVRSYISNADHVVNRALRGHTHRYQLTGHQTEQNNSFHCRPRAATNRQGAARLENATKRAAIYQAARRHTAASNTVRSDCFVRRRRKRTSILLSCRSITLSVAVRRRWKPDSPRVNRPLSEFCHVLHWLARFFPSLWTTSAPFGGCSYMPGP